MRTHVFDSKREAGAAAAAAGAVKLRAALAEHGAATIVVATGASQFEMLDALVREPDIAWENVSAFHLDEYVGLPITHPASFRGYLWKRFVSRLPVPLAAFHYLDAEHNPEAECRRVGNLIRGSTVDVAFIGIGENGHLAFNDPPADFETIEPYHIVTLDETCRMQQLGEGWFPSLDDVPQQAVSMSIRRILAAHAIVCTVPDQRKAEAVKNALNGPITPDVPASILQEHIDCDLFLDKPAASLL
ncbi:MAG: glucosamine-6-phosphate deaminase [Pirellulales bacterium]